MPDWVVQHYPKLELRIAWNQPMFTHHVTYVIGFSATRKHMAMAPERATMIRFEQVMRERGADFGNMFADQPWSNAFDYELLDAFIQHQLTDKRDVTSFWRPQSWTFQHEPIHKTLTTCTIGTCQPLHFPIFVRTRLSTSLLPKSNPSSSARAARRPAQSWSPPPSTKRQWRRLKNAATDGHETSSTAGYKKTLLRLFVNTRTTRTTSTRSTRFALSWD